MTRQTRNQSIGNIALILNKLSARHRKEKRELNKKKVKR